MKKFTLILALLLPVFGFSQTIWKKEADLRKQNKIKETRKYVQSVENPESKWLRDWLFYDRSGRLIESKRYRNNGEVETHHKFEYLNQTTRILIILNADGQESNRIEQEFDLTDTPKPLKSTNSSGILGFEYDEHGNLTKVWRIKENPKVLQQEAFYDENNLPYKKINRVRKRDASHFYQTSFYERDEDGNILKITTESNGNVIGISIYEHKKYGN